MHSVIVSGAVLTDERLMKAAEAEGIPFQCAIGALTLLWGQSQQSECIEADSQQLSDWLGKDFERHISVLSASRYILGLASGLFLIRGNEKRIREAKARSARAVKAAAGRWAKNDAPSIEKCSKHDARMLQASKHDAPSMVLVQKPEPKSRVKSSRQKTEDGVSARDVIAYYSEVYTKRFQGSSPVITGAAAGAAKNIAKSIGQKNIKPFIDAYFTLTDRFIVSKMFSLTELQREETLNKVKVAMVTGVQVTGTMAMQAERSSHNQQVVGQFLKQREADESTAEW